MSRTSARYHKPPPSARPGAASRHRKPPPAQPALRRRVALVVGAAVAVLAVLLSAWPAAAHWVARAPDMAWVDKADALGVQLAGSLAVYGNPQPAMVSEGVAVVPRYYNPLRSISDLVLERIDMGVDFSGSGPIYALGYGVITSATGEADGWPGGGWITYQLTNGPDAGLMVYVAEDVVPTVLPGTRVTPWTVIGEMFDGYDGIETGWAQPDAAQSELAEAAAPEAGGVGPFPTAIGTNFDELLQSLGVPGRAQFRPDSFGRCAGELPPGRRWITLGSAGAGAWLAAGVPEPQEQPQASCALAGATPAPGGLRSFPGRSRHVNCQLSGLWCQVCTNHPAATTSS